MATDISNVVASTPQIFSTNYITHLLVGEHAYSQVYIPGFRLGYGDSRATRFYVHSEHNATTAGFLQYQNDESGIELRNRYNTAYANLNSANLTTHGKLFIENKKTTGACIEVSESSWEKPLKLGEYYLFIDNSGRLRISRTTPSENTSGDVVGTQC